MHLHGSILLAIAFYTTNVLAGPVTVQWQGRTNSAVKNIVVFGDSFSDNGNGSYRITNGTWPVDPPYYDGRFSNGPVWVEDVASELNAELYDFAIGGSSSDNNLAQGYTGSNSTIAVPSALDQLSTYLGGVKANASLSDTLFVVFTGGNDGFFNVNAAGAQAKHFLVASYPDISKLPHRHCIDAATKAQLHKWSIEYRAQIESLAGSQVTYVDLYSLFSDLLAHPRRYGFDPSKISRACLTDADGEAPMSLCTDPDKYIFWDEPHPTRKTHQLMARAAQKALRSALCCSGLYTRLRLLDPSSSALVGPPPPPRHVGHVEQQEGQQT
ncbi:carbohydrate esterase family 16 protein [Athelia psychrophila]|uniref:Carbohydrate esterase family 16 protein n=1 Tax=Athelia psychrophila TaxID=1759441 RepID=A0A166B774_9AGAM|nr:carbohydrate esterase family 16 protein [Fibularhizoctonia sp. CBS 109695]